MNNKRNDTGITAAIYVLLGAGALWQILGLFTALRQGMAAPLLAVLSALLLCYWLRDAHIARGRRIGWAAAVAVTAFAIEWYGVKSGRVFGDYVYGAVLQPQLDSVPLVIGLAWLQSLVSAVAVAQGLLRRPGTFRRLWIAALLMVVLDVAMEPAAVALGYWSWPGGFVPLQNYFAWFILSILFLLAAHLLRIFETPLPLIARHVYWAQLLYFSLIAIF